MSTAGEQLRAAREAQNLTAQQVAELTNMKTDQVIALEEGNFNVFAAPVYVRGFARTYAGVLKLDVAQIVADLDADMGQTEKFRSPPSLATEGQGFVDRVMLQLTKVKWALVLPAVLLGVLIVGGIIGYSAWRRQKTQDPLTNLGPGIYQPTQKPAPQLLPIPTNPPAKK